MPTSALRGYIAETIRELRTSRRADVSKLKQWAKVNPSARRPAYVMAIRDQAWDALANQARAELRARRDDLRDMAQRCEHLVALLQRTGPLVRLINDPGLPIGKRHDWPAMREATKLELPKRGVKKDRAAKILARLKSSDPRKRLNTMLRGLTGSAEQLNHLAESHLRALAGATLGLAVARFNNHVSAVTSLPGTPQTFWTETEARLRKAEREVWKALREGDLLAGWVSATDLARLAASSLLDGALPHAAGLALRRRDSTSPAQDGRLALRFGDLIRDLLRAVAMGHYVAWLAKWPASATPTLQWLRAARNLSFPSAVKPVPVVRIASLAIKPARFSGRSLTIEGVLGPVQIAHRARKAISSASVSDDQGRMVTIAIPYIKLDSGGMVGGAYVRVSGTWQRRSPEVDGPALLIDRINLGELSQQSWSDWATLQLRPILEAVPHGLTAGWSWEPGVDGAGNQLRYGTWFPRKEGRN